MRRHTAKAPSGPATTATPKPDNNAYSKKSGIGPGILRHNIAVGVVVVIVIVRIYRHLRRKIIAEQLQIGGVDGHFFGAALAARSEEHTSELQSRGHLVC